MRIAVIGSGISGLASAYLLNRPAEVHLFERDSRLGGHSHTVDVRHGDDLVPVDTGFIVFNALNYPNLVALFTRLGVAWDKSNMSFGLSLEDGAFEYSGSIRGLVAQPSNLLRARYWRMLSGVLRFYRTGYRAGQLGAPDESLGAFLAREGYDKAFVEDHLLPMSAAIWSCPPGAILDYPVRSLLEFMENHRLLNFLGRPRWLTPRGGSRQYVNRIADSLGGVAGGRIHISCRINTITRDKDGVTLAIEGHGQERFDKVILASHADRSLAMIKDASAQERAILGAFSFKSNNAMLHSDVSFMPRRRAVWSSWNYLGEGESDGNVSLTYWMNRLQNIGRGLPLFVTLNPHHPPDPALVHGSFAYEHPVFDAAAIEAQTRLATIQGRGGLYYAGAWTGHGFHEDGLRSAIAVARGLGATIPWKTEVGPVESRAGGEGRA